MPRVQGLTAREEVFVHAYVETLCGADAAMRAYNCGSRNSARVIAHKVRHRPRVQSKLKELGVNIDKEYIEGVLREVMQQGDNQAARVAAARLAAEINLMLPKFQEVLLRQQPHELRPEIQERLAQRMAEIQREQAQLEEANVEN